jgi:hypothetical protein
MTTEYVQQFYNDIRLFIFYLIKMLSNEILQIYNLLLNLKLAQR